MPAQGRGCCRSVRWIFWIYGFTTLEAEFEHSGSDGSSSSDTGQAKRSSVVVSRGGGEPKPRTRLSLRAIQKKWISNLLVPESTMDAKLIGELFHAESDRLVLKIARNGLALTPGLSVTKDCHQWQQHCRLYLVVPVDDAPTAGSMFCIVPGTRGTSRSVAGQSVRMENFTLTIYLSNSSCTRKKYYRVYTTLV